MWIFGRQRHLNAEMISEFLDGRMISAQEQRVTRHAEACDHCRRELDSLRATISAIQTLPEMTLPRSFTMAAPPPVIAAVRPSMPFRAPTWAYAGAASVAGLALAVIISADTVGLLDPTYRGLPRSFQQAIESAPASGEAELDLATPAATSQPQIAAAPEAGASQAMRSAQSTDGDAGAELGMAPPAEDAQPGLTEFESATAEESADQYATPATGNLSGQDELDGVGKSATADTTASTLSSEEADTSSPEPQILEQNQSTRAIPEGEPGSVVVLTRFEDSGTPLVWRVLETTLAVLAALFLAGLWWKLRASRKATEKSNGG